MTPLTILLAASFIYNIFGSNIFLRKCHTSHQFHMLQSQFKNRVLCIVVVSYNIKENRKNLTLHVKIGNEKNQFFEVHSSSMAQNK